jgi:TonB-linked SusC/RagA family outer membrane protein
MRFQNFYEKYRYVGLLLLLVFLTGAVNAQEKATQPAKTDKTISINLKVIDDRGNPVPQAKVVVGEGMIHAETDANGAYSFMAYPNDFVTISAMGFEKSVNLVQDILLNSSITLNKSKLFMTSDDEIPLPFITEKKRNLTGSTNVLRGDQLERYPSNDLRNAFTGLVPGLRITEFDGSPGVSAEETNGSYGINNKIGVSARGRNMMYIIDGIPMDITEMQLDPQEIESVTTIKDIVGKAMYGPIAANGIILIKTKRGRANEKMLTVNAEEGISIIDRFPGWVSGAEYAQLNNEARQNSGLASLYSSADIDAYALNNPNDLYHPSVDFRGMMLSNTKSYRRASVSASGGNNVVQYSSYIGYSGEGDIYKVGPIADYNRIIASSNVDIRVNEDIKVQFDITAGLTLRRSANFGYASNENSSATDLLELNSALPLINNTPPIAFPVYANNDPSLKYPWLGVSSNYTINPFGALTRNGQYNESGRKGTAKFALDYDLSKLINGLRSQTFLGYDALRTLRIGNANIYIAYISTPSKSATTGNDTILFSKAHDGVVTSTLTNLHDYYYQRISFYEMLNYERSFGVHNIQSSLTYSMYSLSKDGVTETQRQQNGIWTMMYTNNDKYVLEGVLNYAGSKSMSNTQRYKLFPSIGASWILSEEGFMSNLKFVNFLKLRAEAGILGAESFMSPFLYRDNWTTSTGNGFGPAPANQWFGSSTQTGIITAYPAKTGNPNLGWEERKEYSIGLDGLLLNHMLSFEVTYYNNLSKGIINQISNTLPYIAGISNAIPYFNYNDVRMYGLETGIQFTNNSAEFKYSVGGNATIQNSNYVKYNEPDYRFAYQHLTGKPLDTYWGQTFIGKFQNDAEALVVPQIYDAVLKEGDLKYKDMNGDGIIDDNDQSAIGHTTPRLFYSLNANLKYKNFELALIGTGAAFYDIPMTNSYYWNGWGDNNYSNFVRDNIGGAYPRLTYYKVNNNFISSDFWLTKGGYFKIQNVELAYVIPGNKLQIIHSQGIRFYVRGANLLTFTKVKNVDPESINSGVTTYPLYKTFTCGIKLTF